MNVFPLLGSGCIFKRLARMHFFAQSSDWFIIAYCDWPALNARFPLWRAPAGNHGRLMVDVFIKPCTRLSIDEYDYRESLHARAIEGIGHSVVLRQSTLTSRHNRKLPVPGIGALYDWAKTVGTSSGSDRWQWAIFEVLIHLYCFIFSLSKRKVKLQLGSRGKDVWRGP